MASSQLALGVSLLIHYEEQMLRNLTSCFCCWIDILNFVWLLKITLNFNFTFLLDSQNKQWSSLISTLDRPLLQMQDSKLYI